VREGSLLPRVSLGSGGKERKVKMEGRAGSSGTALISVGRFVSY